VAACGSEASPQPTSKVERGMVSTKVSASGALASIKSTQVGFPKGAKLQQIGVKVGDTVRAGQVLARLDPFAFQQQLNQQQSQLRNQQALLDRLLNGNTIEQANRTLDQARKIEDATRESVDKQRSLDLVTVRNSERAYYESQRQLQAAQRQLDFCRSHGQPNTTTGMGGPFSPGAAPTYNLGIPMPPNLMPNNGQGRPDRDGTLGNPPNSYYGSQQGGQDPCASQVNGINSARTSFNTARLNYQQAQKQKRVNEAQGRVSIENAKATVVTALNGQDSAKSDTPANIDAQRGLVANAAALVALAQRDLNDTVLYAPTDGTVGQINGTIGEFIGAQTGLTSQAPGTEAAVPGVGAAATSSQNQISVSTNGSRNGGSFMVLNNVDTFQVVVPFEESDAAKVKVNQPVEITYDALPDVTSEGKVLSVSPVGTDISGVTNYYATIVLNNPDPQLKDGQTAEAGVLTESKDNVLTVPNNAVIKQGGKSFVSVPGPDGAPVQKQFTPGAVGDDRTEVQSGLNEGDQILLPQAQVQSTPGGGGGGGGGGR
jgi:HlyD family secretion protein